MSNTENVRNRNANNNDPEKGIIDIMKEGY